MPLRAPTGVRRGVFVSVKTTPCGTCRSVCRVWTVNSARYIGTGETARILGVDRSTIQRHAAAGTLPYVTKLDGRGGYLFDPAVIHTLATPSSATPIPERRPPADEGVSSSAGDAA